MRSSYQILQGDLGLGREWSPKQARVLLAPQRDLCVDGGRRFGKSEIGAAKFLARVHDRLEAYNQRIRHREAAPWQGLGLPAHRARHYAPNVEAWVLTPRQRHLEQALAKLLRYHSGAYSRFLHPDLGLTRGGEEMWLLVNGAAARIRFAVGSGAAAVVSGALDELWVDEAGLLDNGIDDAIAPVLWERGGRRINTGTPSLGTDHWFTRRCLAGLDSKHEYYQPGIVEPDPHCLTIIGTTHEAYLKEVRQGVVAEIVAKGKSWADQWVRGDWRLPALFIYDEWDERRHLADYDYRTFRLGGRQLPRPDLIVGVIDWAYTSTKPGACAVFHVWHQSPLDRSGSKRPLVIAVQDEQKAQEYTREGWYGTFAAFREIYHVQYWLADPSRSELIFASRKFQDTCGPVRPAEKADKWGRINLLRSLLHHERERSVEPAFYVRADGCHHLPRQFRTYRRKLRPGGEASDQTIDYDDHVLDCCAFLVGKIMRGGQSVPSLLL